MWKLCICLPALYMCQKKDGSQTASFKNDYDLQYDVYTNLKYIYIYLYITGEKKIYIYKIYIYSPQLYTSLYIYFLNFPFIRDYRLCNIKVLHVLSRWECAWRHSNLAQSCALVPENSVIQLRSQVARSCTRLRTELHARMWSKHRGLCWTGDHSRWVCTAPAALPHRGYISPEPHTDTGWWAELSYGSCFQKNKQTQNKPRVHLKVKFMCLSLVCSGVSFHCYSTVNIRLLIESYRWVSVSKQ